MVAIAEDIRTTDECDVENAVKETGFGKFNIRVTVLCALIFMNTAIGIGSVSFILPSAACDLQLDTLDKGRISSTTLLGMVLGSYFWGCLADVKGRRVGLLLALFSYALLEIISAFVTSYWLFLLLKFFSGWSINGQSVIVFTYLGEFQPNQYRDKILSWMEMAWTLGLIVLPLIAWAMIPIELAFVTNYFAIRSWNLFIIVCAIPSLVLGLWLLLFPETPKHLAESNQHCKLCEVLEVMHFQNTGGSFNDYLDKLSKNGHNRLRLMLTFARPVIDGKAIDADNACNVIPIASTISNSQLIWKLLRSICSQTVKLWKPPHLRSTFLTCCLFFCIGSSYYALILWFPEIFQRFGAFEKSQPGESTSVCKVSSFNRTISGSNDLLLDCPTTVGNDVFIQTLILGLACLPVSIVLPLFVDKLGYKFFLIFSTAAASSVTVGLFFVESATENLILSCIFEAFSSVCLSTILSLIVDLFPTDLRVMAASVSVFFGRLGALIGNTLFGYLIDNYCIALISVIASQLCVATIMSLLIPGKSNSHGS